MSCGRARRLLWPDAGPREATAEIMAAREHTGRCPDCRRFLDDMRRLGDGIREAVPRQPAPMEVRDRLFRSIAVARTRGGDRITAPWRRWLGAGLAAVLLLGAAWLSWRGGPGSSSHRPDPLAAIAEDHLQAERSAGLISSDSAEVAGWLRERLPFGVDVPLFPDARLAGARLLLVGGQSGAVVEYAIAGRSLSYYILPGILPGGKADAATELRVRVSSRAGYRIASWEGAGLTHALIGGLPEPRLVELAHYCIEQMMPATEV
jgi:anti-sigma factor RsiW